MLYGLLILESQWTPWISVVSAGVTIAAIVGIWRYGAGFQKSLATKANKADIDKEFGNIRSENKTQADESLRQYRELRTVIEVVQKELTLLDKHSLTVTDLTDMKADIKDLVRGQQEALKLIDNMPDRVTSLEATRNKQSEK